VIFIHGGGFKVGDKIQARTNPLVGQCLDAGVSFVSVDYRFFPTPLPEILRDCARAIQFLRSKAGEWNIDPGRIASYGSSAGAGMSLWMAFHSDLADPKSPDPVLRESTHLACAGSLSGQFSYDFLKWSELWGEEVSRRFSGGYVLPPIYGLKTDEELHGPVGQRIRADCDLISLITKDAPPMFLSSSTHGGRVTTLSQFQHHPKHTQLLYNRLRELGVPVVASIPAFGISPPPGGPATLRDFFFFYLKVKPAALSP
jgi:acetyl esterase/lipase